MRFTKMHGLGNDYIYLNCMDALPEDLPALARRLSHRHFGVGGDGLICVCPSRQGDFRMDMYNADGSQGAMCGNGIRCLGKYVYEDGLTDKTHLTIETAAGLRRLSLHVRGNLVEAVQVDMGSPAVGESITIRVKGEDYTGIPVSMGNPHFVVPVDDPEGVPLARVGPLLQEHLAFPGGVNVEFVRPLCRGRILCRVWERGSGETLACGTGACAALAALATLGRTEREGTVVLPGGELDVRWRREDGHILMTGPATRVFEGALTQEV